MLDGLLFFYSFGSEGAFFYLFGLLVADLAVFAVEEEVAIEVGAVFVEVLLSLLVEQTDELACSQSEKDGQSERTENGYKLHSSLLHKVTVGGKEIVGSILFGYGLVVI